MVAAFTSVWTGTQRRFWRATLYLTLLALIGPLLVFQANLTRISVTNAALGFLIVLAGLMVCRALLAITIRRMDLTDPALAILAFGLLYNSFVGAVPGTTVFLLLAAIVAGLLLVVLRSPSGRELVERGLLIFLGIMVGLFAFNVVRSDVWGQRSEIRAELDRIYPSLPLPRQELPKRPDIYFLVFDRYAGAETLSEVYGFDNSAFLHGLAKRGFAVSPNTYSAYQRTAHSLASTLNLGYLEPLEASSSRDWVPLYERLSKPRLYSFLKQAGYRIHTYGAWWEPTRTSALADLNDPFFAVPESIRAITETSLLSDLAGTTGIDLLDARARQCQRIKHKFHQLKSMEAEDEPIFAFAHFLVPHPPFVIDQDGRCKSVSETKALSRRQNYLAQLEFANDAILDLVDSIIARSPDSVIVFQSDEGPWPQTHAGEEVEFFGADVTAVDWMNVSPAMLKEKMGIPSAIRLPGVDPAAIQQPFAPVNTFRLVLRHLFDVDLPDLPRRMKLFRSDDALYDFSDVTARIETAPSIDSGLEMTSHLAR